VSKPSGKRSNLPLPFCAVFARSSFLARAPGVFSHRIFSRNFPCHGLGLRFFRLRFRIFAFCMGARRLIVFAAAVSFGQATRHATTAASEAYAAAPALQSCLYSSDSPARFRLVVISVVVSPVISAGSFSACVSCSFSHFLSDLVSSCGACLLPPTTRLHLKSWLCEISFSRWIFPFFTGF
jgi:hypothetical protein